MSEGETSHGPSAPTALHRGWYETFTRSGWPGRFVSISTSSSFTIERTETPSGSGTFGGAAHSSVCTVRKRGSSVNTRNASWSGLLENQRYALSAHPFRDERTGS